MPASQLTRALVRIAVNIVPCTNLLQVVSVYVRKLRSRKAAVLWVHVSENFQKCHHMIQGAAVEKRCNTYAIILQFVKSSWVSCGALTFDLRLSTMLLLAGASPLQVELGANLFVYISLVKCEHLLLI